MTTLVKNSRRTVAIAASCVVLALAIAWVVFGPGQAPAGQPPLIALDSTSLEALRADFNQHVNQVRLVVLLAPT